MSLALITPSRAEALKSFVYVGQDHSFLYNWCLSAWAQFLVDTVTPEWLAPNTITLLGLLATLFATAVAFVHAPDLGAKDMPAWVALLLALCMFAYSTLDNMDGKQARKTKSSSALGLLFDHGAWE
jgi:ethanolaminephosphotransferase